RKMGMPKWKVIYLDIIKIVSKFGERKLL
ncbi:MAG: hypothetical protein ACI9Z4_002228, partial [Polaribacter sp.]